MQLHRATALVALVGIAGCSEATQPLTVDSDVLVSSADAAVLGKVNGGGHYALPIGGGVELAVQFAVSGQQIGADESARGTFHHRLELGGQSVEFYGELTCLAIDDAEGRAWIGGVITENRSELEPFASGAIYEVGRDIWFRVLDVGSPSEGVDRTTFVGFEGSIITSKDYCDLRDWPDGNLRTNAVSTGNINVMP